MRLMAETLGRMFRRVAADFDGFVLLFIVRTSTPEFTK